MNRTEEYILPRFNEQVKNLRENTEKQIDEAKDQLSIIMPKIEEKCSETGGTGLVIGTFNTDKGFVLVAMPKKNIDPDSIVGVWDYEADHEVGCEKGNLKIIPSENVPENLAASANKLLEIGFETTAGVASSNGKRWRGKCNIAYPLYK